MLLNEEFFKFLMDNNLELPVIILCFSFILCLIVLAEKYNDHDNN